MLAQDQYLKELKPVLYQAAHRFCPHCGKMGFMMYPSSLTPQSFSLGNLLEPITAPSSSPILTCCGFFSKGNPWRLTRTGPALHCRHSYWSVREWRAVRRLNLSLQNSLLWAELRKWRNNWRESTLSSPQDHKGIGDEVSNVGMELKMWLLCRHL